ncbi:c-type cytochrome [Chelatococcus sp. GCM10030263]|uniref:c-type cytochrome n=1 Tax=Chelatococcus sp. GCM10030263 TaxID=3273387 RepID=UPI0036203D80
MMDSFELNKIAGAVLGTLVFAMGLGIVADEIFKSHAPAIPGYDLPAAQEAAPGGAAPAAPQVEPIAVRLQTADPARGEKAVAKCAACHNFVEGAGAKIGPDLYNVVDRPKGSFPGFSYSSAMKEHAAKGEKWTYEEIDHFIANPRAYMKGTIMSFAGVAKPEERADIIAYLRTLSHSPAPLPTP